jgi:type II secretory pathway component PulC
VDWGRAQTWRDLIEQPERWAVGLCVIVALVLVGIEAGNLAMALRNPAPTFTVASTGAKEDYVGRVSGANLFGVAPPTINDQTLPQTQMQLTLRGVFTSDDPAFASAIIESEDGKMQIVKSGGGLGADASLKQVYANRVVIARGGVLENLYFPTSSAPETIATAAPIEASPVPAGTEDGEDEHKANILRRLEELRSRGALSQ